MTPHVSSFQLHYYLCFKTHYRRPLLLNDGWAHDLLSEVCTRQHYHLLDTDISKANLRLLLSLNPSQSVSEEVKFLKGNVSREFGLKFPDLLKAHFARSLWARGYLATSSGKVNLTAARNYVDSQAAHHGYRGAWTRPLKFRNPDFKCPAFSFDHCFCKLDYHFALVTQNRLPLFDESMAPALFDYIMAIGRKRNFAVDRIGLMPDHMHLIVEAVQSLSAEMCAAAIVENTRHWMTKRYWGVLKQLEAWNVWQPSCYAATVGEFSTAQVREYLRRA